MTITQKGVEVDLATECGWCNLLELRQDSPWPGRPMISLTECDRISQTEHRPSSLEGGSKVAQASKFPVPPIPKRLWGPASMTLSAQTRQRGGPGSGRW